MNTSTDTTKKVARIYTTLAVLIITLGVALSFFTIAQQSSTVDESVHLASGYSYWATGDFRMNPEHPLLVKEIAAIPLLFLHLNFNPQSPNFDQVRLWDFGPEVIYHNNVPGPEIITLGRIPLLIFLVLLGVLTYKWSKKLFGEKTALVILLLTMTCQNLLAHSGLVTTDIPITFSYLFVCYSLARLLEHKTQKTFAWFVISLTLVLLVKYSAVVIAVAIIFIMLAHTLLHAKKQEKGFVASAVRDFGKNKILPFVVALVMAFVFIIFAYGGDFKTVYSATDSASAEVVRDFVANQPQAIEDALNWFGNNVPIPAFHYIEGMALVLTHNKGGHTTFFLGEVSNQGWWYYFPTVFLFKTSLPNLLLFISVVALGLSRAALSVIRTKKDRLKSWLAKIRTINFDFIVLSLAPLIFFAISMNSKLNLGVRYVIPVYPFLFILSGHILRHFFRSVWLKASLVIFLVLSLYTTFKAFPNYLSYYNVLATRNGVTPLNISEDSNLDWGQNLPQLKQYMDENHIDSIYLRYFGTADPAAFGINTKPFFPTTNDIKNGQVVSGYVVVSATALAHPEEGYEWPLLRKPVAIINNSLYVFNFDHLK